MEKYKHIQRSTLLELLGHVNSNTFTTHEVTQIILDIIDKNYDLKKESKSLTGIDRNFQEDEMNETLNEQTQHPINVKGNKEMQFYLDEL